MASRYLLGFRFRNKWLNVCVVVVVGEGGRFTRESIEFSESYFKRVNGYLENFEVFV